MNSKKNISTMNNYELGVIAKAFVECGRREKCADCPCEGVLCGIEHIAEARDSFMREVAKRLMKTK